MKVRILTDVQADHKNIKGGTLADISEGSALRLIQLGWAEEAVEEIKAPAITKKTAKKTRKKD